MAKRNRAAGNDVDPITLGLGDRLEERERERGFVLLPPPNDPFLAPPVVNGVTEMRRYHFTDPFGEVDPGTKKTKGFSGRENIAPR